MAADVKDGPIRVDGLNELRRGRSLANENRRSPGFIPFASDFKKPKAPATPEVSAPVPLGAALASPAPKASRVADVTFPCFSLGPLR
eukprot:7390634-Prymnesium_polylepis.1